jgi:hypothetical protein
MSKQQWQPIETCPNGTMVLFCSMAATEARHWCWVDWMADGKFMSHRHTPAKPTHWMYLPAPPKA